MNEVKKRDTATILVVEDEQSVRTLLRNCLQSEGHEILEAASREDAMEFCSRQDRIDLVLSDITLPDGNGLELLEQLRTSRPTLPGIFISGYTQEYLSREKGIDLNGNPFLPKPFHPNALRRMVAQTLAQH